MKTTRLEAVIVIGSTTLIISGIVALSLLWFNRGA